MSKGIKNVEVLHKNHLIKVNSVSKKNAENAISGTTPLTKNDRYFLQKKKKTSHVKLKLTLKNCARLKFRVKFNFEKCYTLTIPLTKCQFFIKSHSFSTASDLFHGTVHMKLLHKNLILLTNIFFSSLFIRITLFTTLQLKNKSKHKFVYIT